MSECGSSDKPSDPASALRMLTRFFEDRHMMTQEDFLIVLRKSQAGAH